MKKPIISFITPIYNTKSSYIEECLNSILNANINVSYEIIIVNDGSTNTDTLNYLENLDKPNIKLFHQENKGVSAARNFAISKSSGEFIFPMDSDDLLIPDTPNKIINFLIKNPKYSIVYGNMKNFGDRDYQWKTGSYNKFKLLYLTNYIPSICVYRKVLWEDLKGYSEKHKIAEDWDFWVRASIKNYKFKYFDLIYYLHRIDDVNTSLYNREVDKSGQYIKLTKDNYDNIKEVNFETVNEYILHNFKDNKIALIKLMIFTFIPSLGSLLLKKGIFKNKIVVN